MNVISVKQLCRHYVSLITLLCVLVIFGCNNSSVKTLSGKYVDEITPQNFTEFKADRTFISHKGNNNIIGSYSIDGQLLTLRLSSGEIFMGKIEGKTIIGDGGGRSTKQ
jgi:hypothetical protein